MAIAWHRPEFDIMHVLQPMSSRSRIYFAFAGTLELIVCIFAYQSIIFLTFVAFRYL